VQFRSAELRGGAEVSAHWNTGVAWEFVLLWVVAAVLAPGIDFALLASGWIAGSNNFHKKVGTMKRLLPLAMFLGMNGLGLNLMAQNQSSSAQDPQPQSQQQMDTPSQQSARAFEGKITKFRGKLVLQESSTQTAYQLDDQDKAKQFEGKSVKVIATLDLNSNMLHVVDITSAER
jgi:hypothetical protein